MIYRDQRYGAVLPTDSYDFFFSLTVSNILEIWKVRVTLHSKFDGMLLIYKKRVQLDGHESKAKSDELRG